jgi:hypothetical protein
MAKLINKIVIAYERIGPKLIKVTKDGAFAGFLRKSSHYPTGFHGKRYIIWSCDIEGREIRANSITAAKAKIEKEAK